MTHSVKILLFKLEIIFELGMQKKVKYRNLKVRISDVWQIVRLLNGSDFERRLRSERFRLDFGCSVG